MKRPIIIGILVALILAGFGPVDGLADQIPVIARLCIGDSLDNFGHRIESAGDINADGYNDVWITRNYWSDPISGKASLYLFYGGNPMDTIPDLVINDTIYSIVNVKDFNQDGFDDFIIFYGGSSEYYGLHYGGPVFDTDPDMIFPVQNPDFMQFGHSSTICGGYDMDNDNLPDLVIAETGNSPEYIGKIYFYGSYPEFDTIPDVKISNDGSYPEHSYFGLAIDFVENLNGNSYLACSRWGNGTYETRGSVYLYEIECGGSHNCLDTIPDIIVGTPVDAPTYHFGDLLKNAGDLNQDGFEELIIATIASTHGWIYKGGELFDTIPDITIVPQFELLEPIGDVNNDSFPDFLIGEQPLNGRAWIYYGGEDFDGFGDMNVDFLGWQINNFGKSIAGLGDVNGDGIDDFAVGALVEDNNYWPGVVYIYAGYNGNPSDVSDHEHTLNPDHYHLYQNYPNPFNASTTVEFEIPVRQKIRLEVIDVLGRVVSCLEEEVYPAGRYETVWDGRDDTGALLPSGVYFCRLRGVSVEQSVKMILLK